jgi:hypothetical protein
MNNREKDYEHSVNSQALLGNGTSQAVFGVPVLSQIDLA